MPFPSPGDLLSPGIEPRSLALQVDSLPPKPPGKETTDLINTQPSSQDFWSNALVKSRMVAQRVKCLPAMWEIWVRSLGKEDPLEKEMATHSSILAWKIPYESGSEVAQSCLTLCDSLPGSSSVHGISQARILEWGASGEPVISSPGMKNH